MGGKKGEEAERAELLPDRVWFTFGMTASLGPYESGRLDAGMSTDVLPGESFDDALTRIQGPVIAEIERGIEELAKKKLVKTE